MNATWDRFEMNHAGIATGDAAGLGRGVARCDHDFPPSAETKSVLPAGAKQSSHNSLPSEVAMDSPLGDPVHWVLIERQVLPPSDVTSMPVTGRLPRTTPESKPTAAMTGSKFCGQEWGGDYVLPPSMLDRTSNWQKEPLGQGWVTAQAVRPPIAMSYTNCAGKPALFQVLPPSWVTKAPLYPYTKPSRRLANRTCLGPLPS